MSWFSSAVDWLTGSTTAGALLNLTTFGSAGVGLAFSQVVLDNGVFSINLSTAVTLLVKYGLPAFSKLLTLMPAVVGTKLSAILIIATPKIAAVVVMLCWLLDWVIDIPLLAALLAFRFAGSIACLIIRLVFIIKGQVTGSGVS